MKVLKCALPPVITALMLLVVYAVKHIYPFGINTIDYYDMGQQIVPFYYHVYDFLHGEKNLFYDPYTALSVNMAMSTSGCSQFSLFNLFFLFVKRDAVLESLSFFLMFKMMCMSLAMYFYIDRRFDIPEIYKTAFSVGYAFSGYVMTLYMTIQWMDIAAIFPIIIYFLGKLLREGKCRGYNVMLTLSFVACYYLSVMILIYIVLMVGVDVVLGGIGKSECHNTGICKINNKTETDVDATADTDECTCVGEISSRPNLHLVKLFVATVLSIVLSMFILLPQIYQTLLSARFNNESGGGMLAKYLQIVSTSKPAYTSRWWTLLGLSFAFAVIAYGVVKYLREGWAENKQTILITIAVLFIVLSELIVEGVNLMWHFGSYIQYPIRNGFMINFTVAVLACVYIEKIYKCEGVNTIRVGDDATNTNINETKSEEEFSKATTRQIEDNNIKSVNDNIYAVLRTAAVTIVFAVCGIIAYNKFDSRAIRGVFHFTTVIMAMTFVIYIGLMIVKRGRYMKMCAIVMLAEFIVFGYIFIGNPGFDADYMQETEQNSEFIRICAQLDEAFDFGDTVRVKNPDMSLNANYGLILRQPALGNWTHLLSPLLQRDAAKMGYSVQYTRLLDAGGTVFSDALIGVNTIITCIPQDESLYTLVDTVNVEIDHLTGERADYYLYECKYQLPFGVVAGDIDYGFGEDITTEGNDTEVVGTGSDVDENTNASSNANSDVVDIYNAIYRSIGGEGDIACEELSLDYNSNNTQYSELLNVDGNKALYYMSGQVDTDDYNTSIIVNGEKILVPSIGEMDNTLYPAHFNNNMLYLGTFTDEEVTVDIEIADTDRDGNTIESEISPRIISIDMDKMRTLCTEYNDKASERYSGKADYRFVVDVDASVDANANVDTDLSEPDTTKLAEGGTYNSYLLLPLSYDKGYSATINGNATEVIPVGGMFCAVQLTDGVNDVAIKFLPRGLIAGVVISAIGILLVVLLCVLDKKYNFINQDYNWLNTVYAVGFIVCMVGMYAIPYVFAVINIIK